MPTVKKFIEVRGVQPHEDDFYELDELYIDDNEETLVGYRGNLYDVRIRSFWASSVDTVPTFLNYLTGSYLKVFKISCKEILGGTSILEFSAPAISEFNTDASNSFKMDNIKACIKNKIIQKTMKPTDFYK